MQHDWVKSTLGHGNTMCRRCFITDMEAAAIGVSGDCDGPAAPPLKAGNDNAAQEAIDAACIHDDDSDGDNEEYDESEECGRWDNGRLSKQCSKAGSEECDWICPIGLP